MLKEVEEVDKVFYAQDIRKGFKMFEIIKIDVLIFCIHLPNKELKELMRLTKSIFKCSIILLSNYTDIKYVEQYKSFEIDYLLDKSRLNELPTTLSKISGENVKLSQSYKSYY